jgi:hypothetical protein
VRPQRELLRGAAATGRTLALVSGRRSFSDVPCALCGAHLSSRKGEHVLPQFLLRALFPEDPSGYYTEVNGVRVVDRHGREKSSPSITRRQLPMCNLTTGGTCNDVLAERFEHEETCAAVLRYFDDPLGMLTAKETADTAIWWLKTLLLCAHPQTQASDEIGPQGWEEIDANLYSWLVDGSAPPAWLSIWMAVLDGTNTDEHDRTATLERGEPRIGLPHFSVAGVRYRSQVFPLGLRNLRFQLVHHPGWEPMHTFERTGDVVRIWPPSPQGLDLGSIPRLGVERAAEYKQLWGLPMGVFLADDANPLEEPWELGPGWTALHLPGARGGTLG